MSKPKLPKSSRFIKYLQEWEDSRQRNVLANLRRGAGKIPGTEPTMYPYIVPWIDRNMQQWEEEAYYLIAALFAFHPKSTTKGNLGQHFALTDPSGSNEAIERRFALLLNTHADDLYAYLYRAISFLKAKDVPINWLQLFEDIQKWEEPETRSCVQKGWAMGFWGRSSEESQKDNNESID